MLPIYNNEHIVDDVSVITITVGQHANTQGDILV